MCAEFSLRERCQKNVSLAGLTTFRIGGPAELFFEARSQQECVEALTWASQQRMPWFLLGGGSNLVVSDAGCEGLVIRNCSAEPDQIDIDHCLVTVPSGRPLEHLLEVACQHGLAGLEALAGIPGSVGGAICGNAGAYGQCIADSLFQARVLFPNGLVETVEQQFFAFSYRHSRLKLDPAVILSATFRLRPGNSEQIRAQMLDIVAQRIRKHPSHEIGCAGSFFKNLPPLPGETRRRAAGEFLEKAGVKVFSVGGAAVFEKHANFIINRGTATAADVKTLAGNMKAAVLKKFDITLEEEVLYVGR